MYLLRRDAKAIAPRLRTVDCRFYKRLSEDKLADIGP